MRTLVVTILALLATQGCATSKPAESFDSGHLEFYRGGDDGLTLRLFEAVVGGEKKLEAVSR